MKRLALITAALVGMAGVAHAQPMNTPNSPAPYHHTRYWSPMMAQACGNRVAITDEYGFRYDSRGDRLNAQGCVIRPPHSLPGAKVIQG